MKKFFIFAFAAITALATWGQTNLALNQPAIATSGAAQVGNDGSNDSRWESGHGVDPQNWQVDLGEAQTFNSVVILWEGAYGKSFQILAGDNVDADGWLTDGEVVAEVTDQVLAGFPYKQVLSFDAVTHRYVQFHGIARGTGYGYSFWEFEVYNLEEELKVTSLSIAAERTNAVVGDNVNFTVTAKDQMGGNIEPGTLTWSSTNPAVGTVTDGVFTALAAGTTVISVTAGDVTSNEVTMNVAAEAVPAPTANANEPTDLELNVIAIYSATYGKGLQDNNPGWGIGGGAPNPLYSSIEEVALVEGDAHKTVHVKGAGMNSRTKNAVAPNADYNTAHVALYPFSATKCKIFGDNAYDNAIEFDGLVPGQWNYVTIEGAAFTQNYMCIELVGEYEFYLDHFYLAKPAVEDNVNPTLDKAELVKANALSVVVALKATDDKAEVINYLITDQNGATYYGKGANGEEIQHTISGLKAGTDYTFTIVAQDENANTSDALTVQATTTALTAAPASTQAAEDVISIYSDAYTTATPNLGYYDWGSPTRFTGITIDGNPTLQFENMDYYGLGFNTQLDVTEMDFLHIDIYSDQAGTLGIVPIWWNAEANAGFTTGTPWLPVHDDYTSENAQAEAADPASVLAWYHRLADFRQANEVLCDGDYREVAASSEQVYAFTRENGDDKLLIAVNFSGSEAPVDLTGSGIASFEDVEVLLSSYDDIEATAGTPEALRPYEAIVARIR